MNYIPPLKKTNGSQLGKICKKNKMEKGLKINLPLEDQSWMLRHGSGVFLLAGDKCVFYGISSRFLVVC